jgi:cyclopropane-fatty-acyl-phospholipid synthase
VSDQSVADELGASRDAIEFHYDVGNAFYELWLDPTMTYSCAMFGAGATTLEAAQRAKLQYWLERLSLQDGDRLLDVGCGWGGMLRAATETFPALDATGLTLSSAQAQYIAAAPWGDAIDVRLESWEEHVPDREYDGIVSLGAFEHFARPGFSRSERVEVYERFFRFASRSLKSEGRLCLQSIALEDQEERIESGLGKFFTVEVFPESSLPRIGEIVDAAEGEFRLVGLRADPDDYARTCHEWRERLCAHRRRAEEVVGEEAVAHYRKLLFLAEMEFVSRSSTLYRLVFERRPTAVSRLRGSA